MPFCEFKFNTILRDARADTTTVEFTVSAGDYEGVQETAPDIADIPVSVERFVRTEVLRQGRIVFAGRLDDDILNRYGAFRLATDAPFPAIAEQLPVGDMPAVTVLEES